MLDLSGIRVAISAAASGIGLEISRTFKEAGAEIFICDIDLHALECAAREGNLEGVVSDVSVPDQASNFISQAAASMGGLDVLINNAGIAGPTARVEDVNVAEWRRTMDINISGHFYCTRAAIPFLRASRNSQIINMASVAGRLGYAYRTPYAASKWAIIGFTKSLAKELGPEGIRVNSVLPGIVNGPRTEGVIQARANALGITFDDMRQQYIMKSSLRKLVLPRDIANVMAFLCSPESEMISGQLINVDGNIEYL